MSRFLKCPVCSEVSGQLKIHLVKSHGWLYRESKDTPTPPHNSDCSANNEPAYPAGECDCDARQFSYYPIQVVEAKENEQ